MYDFLAKFIKLFYQRFVILEVFLLKDLMVMVIIILVLKEDLIFPEIDFNKHDKSRGLDLTLLLTFLAVMMNVNPYCFLLLVCLVKDNRAKS